jgi:hypothetical protein
MKINPLAIALRFLPLVIGNGNQQSQQQGQQQDDGDFPDSKHMGYNLKDRALLSVKRKDGSVTVILGGRDSGKSTVSWRLAEFFGRPTFAVSPEQRPPKWITRIDLKDLTDIVVVPPYSTVIIDDLPVLMSSRQYTDQLVQIVEKIIPMVRHERKLHLIFNSQNSSLSDKYVLDNDIAVLKPLGIFSAATERPEVWKIYREKVNPIFDGKSENWIKRHAYVITRSWEGVITVAKP